MNQKKAKKKSIKIKKDENSHNPDKKSIKIQEESYKPNVIVDQKFPICKAMCLYPRNKCLISAKKGLTWSGNTVNGDVMLCGNIDQPINIGTHQAPTTKCERDSPKYWPRGGSLYDDMMTF